MQPFFLSCATCRSAPPEPCRLSCGCPSACVTVSGTQVRRAISPRLVSLSAATTSRCGCPTTSSASSLHISQWQKASNFAACASNGTPAYFALPSPLRSHWSRADAVWQDERYWWFTARSDTVKSWAVTATGFSRYMALTALDMAKGARDACGDRIDTIEFPKGYYFESNAELICAPHSPAAFQERTFEEAAYSTRSFALVEVRISLRQKYDLSTLGCG